MDAERTRNEKVFAALSDAEADFSLPHEIEHFIYGPAEALVQLSKKLVQQEYQTAFSETGALLATRWAMLDLDGLTAETTQLAQIAAAFGCEYDGWGTGVRRNGDGGPQSIASN